MSVLRYISHPEIVVEPGVPVPDWRLSDVGRQRATAMLRQPWVSGVVRVVSSGERKACETAEILGGHLGVEVEIRPNTGEIDRSATGYVPHERHEALADRCFGSPTRSAAGWETAIDAQRRIVAALADLLGDPAGESGEVAGEVAGDDVGDVVIVGHGGVGTLLLCHLGGWPIDRRRDQPGGGHHWCLDRSTRRVVHSWTPVDGPPGAHRRRAT